MREFIIIPKDESGIESLQAAVDFEELLKAHNMPVDMFIRDTKPYKTAFNVMPTHTVILNYMDERNIREIPHIEKTRFMRVCRPVTNNDLHTYNAYRQRWGYDSPLRLGLLSYGILDSLPNQEVTLVNVSNESKIRELSTQSPRSIFYSIGRYGTQRKLYWLVKGPSSTLPKNVIVKTWKNFNVLKFTKWFNVNELALRDYFKPKSQYDYYSNGKRTNILGNLVPDN